MEDSMNVLVRKVLADGSSVMQAIERDTRIHTTLIQAAEATASAMKAGHKLMLAGNGGSAADAQHVAAEFVSRLVGDRPAMRAIALTTDTSILTAIGNDYGYERSFTRQIEALGQCGDVFLGISTSGRSPNVLAALELCRQLGVISIGFTGNSSSKMEPLCDYLIRIPSDVTMYIQQAHLAIEHAFCLLTERFYFDQSPAVVLGCSASMGA